MSNGNVFFGPPTFLDKYPVQGSATRTKSASANDSLATGNLPRYGGRNCLQGTRALVSNHILEGHGRFARTMDGPTGKI